MDKPKDRYQVVVLNMKTKGFAPAMSLGRTSHSWFNLDDAKKELQKWVGVFSKEINPNCVLAIAKITSEVMEYTEVGLDGDPSPFSPKPQEDPGHKALWEGMEP
jgi:hypothetical protein